MRHKKYHKSCVIEFKHVGYIKGCCKICENARLLYNDAMPTYLKSNTITK